MEESACEKADHELEALAQSKQRRGSLRSKGYRWGCHTM